MAHILVVDDEPSILTTLETHLSLGGHGVHTAPKLADARRIVASVPLDLVFLDAYLGKERGLDFLLELKASHPGLPVVMISGQSEMSDVVAALKAGAFDFLEKPLDPQRLAVLVAHSQRQEKLRSEVDDLRQERRRKRRKSNKRSNKKVSNFLYNLGWVAAGLAIGLPLLALILYFASRF